MYLFSLLKKRNIISYMNVKTRNYIQLYCFYNKKKRCQAGNDKATTGNDNNISNTHISKDELCQLVDDLMVQTAGSNITRSNFKTDNFVTST